jgi:hypothetical protein
MDTAGAACNLLGTSGEFTSVAEQLDETTGGFVVGVPEERWKTPPKRALHAFFHAMQLRRKCMIYKDLKYISVQTRVGLEVNHQAGHTEYSQAIDF